MIDGYCEEAMEEIERLRNIIRRVEYGADFVELAPGELRAIWFRYKEPQK